MRKLETLLASISLLGAPALAGAATFSGTITPDTTSASWQGTEFQNGSTPAPELCVVPGACDEFDLTLGLGEGYFDGNPGTVQIGIRWKGATEAESEGEYDTFDLYVYDSTGALVASSVNPLQSSAGIASTAQVVDLPSGPADGLYKVYVVPSNVQDRSYAGLAFVRSLVPPVSGALLPDLVPLQPTNFRMAIGTYSLTRVNDGSLPANVRPSCYAEETAQDETHPTRCLRFDAEVANLGDGPFLLDIDLSTMRPQNVDPATLGNPDAPQPYVGGGDGSVTQVIENSDGTETTRPAGSYEFHVNHAHVHYKAFAKYELYDVNGDGSRGTLASPSLKSDFCMIDVDDLHFGLPGNQPREHHFPQCNALDQGRALGGRLVQRQGINRGWGDVYTWDLPGQYIDISNVADGVYDVVITANPAGKISEKTAANDEAATRVHLSGDTVTCVPVPYGCPVGTTPEP